MAKRLLNLKFLALAAALLFIVACYYAARRVMASDIELGMDRAAIIKILGEPAEFGLFVDSRSDVWERTVISGSIYKNFIIADYDAEGNVNLICVVNVLFDHQFIDIRTNIKMPSWIH